MESEGDKILGAWRFKMMGAIIKFEFSKEGENKYGGRMLETEVPERLKPIVERKLKGRNGMKLEDLYGRNLFCLTYNPMKNAYEFGEADNPLVRYDNIPSIFRGSKMSFEAGLTSSNTLVLRAKILGLTRRIVLKKEDE